MEILTTEDTSTHEIHQTLEQNSKKLDCVQLMKKTLDQDPELKASVSNQRKETKVALGITGYALKHINEAQDDFKKLITFTKSDDPDVKKTANTVLVRTLAQDFDTTYLLGSLDNNVNEDTLEIIEESLMKKYKNDSVDDLDEMNQVLEGSLSAEFKTKFKKIMKEKISKHINSLLKRQNFEAFNLFIENNSKTLEPFGSLTTNLLTKHFNRLGLKSLSDNYDKLVPVAKKQGVSRH